MAPPDHPAFPQPSDPTIPAWRYLDLPRLLSMLMRRQLHMTRLDRLIDKFEGTIPIATRGAMISEFGQIMASSSAAPLMEGSLKYIRQIALQSPGAQSSEPVQDETSHMLEFFRQILRMARAIAISKTEAQTGSPVSAQEAAQLSRPELVIEGVRFAMTQKRVPGSLEELTQAATPIGESMSSVERETLVREIVDSIFAHARSLRRHLYVNCWHLGENESEAMWRIYCGSDSGLAIKLPYDQLRASLNGPNTHVGTVNYLKFSVDCLQNWDPFGFTLAMQKRKEFTYEQEARIVLWKGPPNEDGPASIGLPWEPAALIDKIVISPYAGSWYADTVREVVARLEPSMAGRVVESSMAGDPASFQELGVR
jgi:hypothetical protein